MISWPSEWSCVERAFTLRYVHAVVYRRYQCLTRRHGSGTLTNTEHVLAVIQELNIPQTEWQIGRTKVFLRSAVHEPLEDARKQVVHVKATVVQAAWRGLQERRRFLRVRNAALCIQHAYLGWKQRIVFLRTRRAAIVIQSHLRGVFAREVAAALREMRRVDEEMRKRERLEAERREREAERKERESRISDKQAEEERRAIEECERLVEFRWPKNEREGVFIISTTSYNIIIIIITSSTDSRPQTFDRTILVFVGVNAFFSIYILLVIFISSVRCGCHIAYHFLIHIILEVFWEKSHFPIPIQNQIRMATTQISIIFPTNYGKVLRLCFHI